MSALDRLPFADYADDDPNRLPLDEQPRWSPEEAARGHRYKTCKCHPSGYCLRCGVAPELHEVSA